MRSIFGIQEFRFSEGPRGFWVSGLEVKGLGALRAQETNARNPSGVWRFGGRDFGGVGILRAWAF